jgi:hypothetical protein
LIGKNEAAHIRKRHIQHNHIGRRFLDLGKCFGAGESFSDADYVFRCFDQCAGAGYDDRMIIDDKSADRICHGDGLLHDIGACRSAPSLRR